MSNNVQMSTVIGGQSIAIGQCLPAQARILVKKGHAKWEDGGLVLNLRPIHLAVALNHRRLDNEGDEVSNAELERRIEWLRSIMGAVVNADTHGSDLHRIQASVSGLTLIIGPDGTPLADERVEKLMAAQEAKKKEYQAWIHSSLVGEDPSLPDIPEEEAGHWYIDVKKEFGTGKGEDEARELALSDLWNQEFESGNLYHYMKLHDSRNAPVRNSEPGPEPKFEARVGHDDVLAEEGPSADWKEVQRTTSVTLPVRFTQRATRSPKAKWPTQTCPKCGVGKDTDGDGDCAACESR